MSVMRYVRRYLAVSACFALAACAGGGGGGGEEMAAPGGGGDRVSFVINNDMVPGVSVTVFIVPDTGGRRRLGSLAPTSRRTFAYNPVMPSLDYRLVAEIRGQRDRESLPFTLTGITSVQWDVSDTNPRLRR